MNGIHLMEKEEAGFHLFSHSIENLEILKGIETAVTTNFHGGGNIGRGDGQGPRSASPDLGQDMITDSILDVCMDWLIDWLIDLLIDW